MPVWFATHTRIHMRVLQQNLHMERLRMQSKMMCRYAHMHMHMQMVHTLLSVGGVLLQIITTAPG